MPIASTSTKKRAPDGASVYPQLTANRPGIVGAPAARAEAHAVRVALIYAIIDSSNAIRLPHLEAALEVLRYVHESVVAIFGTATGDRVADEVLRALRRSPQGLTRSELRDLFARHKKSDEVGRALASLLRQGLVRSVSQITAGRPAERWFACEQERDKREKEPASEGMGTYRANGAYRASGAMVGES